MAQEREENKRKKAEAGDAERQRKAELKLANKENHASKNKDVDIGLQKAEISSSECAACFGWYEDDLIDGGYSVPTRTVGSGCMPVASTLIVTVR